MPPAPHLPPDDALHELQQRADYLGFRRAVARKLGPVCSFDEGGRVKYLVSGPDLIEEVFVKQRDAFDKGPMEPLRRLLGQGLLTSDGPLHARQRRRLQPLFTPRSVAPFVPVAVQTARELGGAWVPGTRLDIAHEMSIYALRVLTRSLMGDTLAHIDEVNELYRETARLAFDRAHDARFAEQKARLCSLIQGMLTQHRERQPTDDVLSRLLDTPGDVAEDTSDRQVVDEILTMLFAGHETTANALSWTWYLTARDAALEARLHEEVDRVLEGRDATTDDVASLQRTRRIFLETMRLYPPVWTVGRTATTDVTLGGFDVPAGAIVQIGIDALHHDPNYYPQPEKFDEDRWLPERVAERPRLAYVPFAAGDRVCIGESFAIMEAVAALATFAQHWRFTLAEDRVVEPFAQVTVQPRGGVPVIVEAR